MASTFEYDRGWRVDAFTGVGCSGNAHHVFCLKHHFSEADAKAFSLSIAPIILVCVVLDDKPVPQREGFDTAQSHFGILKPAFFHRGHTVSFCGSGCMALASVFFEYLCEQKHIGSSCNNDLRLRLKNRDISVSKLGNVLSMSMRVGCKVRHTKKRFWELLIRQDAINVVRLVEGYVIVEIANATLLRYLKPNLAKLKRLCEPALIVTAPGDAANEDYVMRYFAPQFGNPEDAATGSANFYLMRYWQQKRNKMRLIGRQLSAEGGMFYGRIQGGLVTLKGRVDIR